MLDKILRLGKETVIYGLSTVIGRLLNFLIVPFYANFLLPAENGIISNVYAYIAFAFVIFCYGMEPAYMRFVSSLEIGDKKQNFSVPFFSLVITSTIFSTVIHYCSKDIAILIGIGVEHYNLVKYAGWILCFDTLSIIPFASLRMERKAKEFALIKIFNIIINLILNIYLILFVKMHAEGVFLANLIASIVTFFIISILSAKQITFNLPKNLYKEILKFGLPYIPAGLAGIAMQVIDRPIVKLLTDNATLGIYQINYRLGIFMMLIVGMFDYAWRPFFLNHAKDPDAKILFSKVFTYFTIGAMTIFLVVSLFINDLVRLRFFGKQFFPQIYWQGTEIVPWILMAYVFTGAYVIFVVGVYLQKKTKYLPFISGGGALLNVVANFYLIPKLGILGAALSTLLGYFVMAVGMYITSQKYYYIVYEWSKVFKVVLSAIIFFLVFKALNLQPLEVYSISVKIILLILFVLSLFVLKVLDVKGIEEIRNILNKVIKRDINNNQNY